MASEVRTIQPEGLAKPFSAYSNASRVKASRFLFIAGQVALDVDGNLVGQGDIKEQARQIFANIKLILTSEGLEMSSIAKFTTYIARKEDIKPFYEVRDEIFPELFPSGDYPPNTLLVVAQLVRPEFLLEIEAVAAYSD